MTPDGWRREKQGNHLYRPKWVDFQGRAIHQLTLVTTSRKPLLGSLVIPDNDPEKAFISRTPLGEKVAEEIEHIPTYKDASNIEIYRYVIMPDHIHILLRVHERLPKHLGQYVRWFKRQCTAACRLFAANPANNPTSGCSLLGAIPPSNQSLAADGSLLAATPASSDTLLQCSRKLTREQIDSFREECLAEAANGTVYISGAISEGSKDDPTRLPEFYNNTYEFLKSLGIEDI